MEQWQITPVCPLAQGWDPDIALGSQYNFRFILGYAKTQDPRYLEWYRSIINIGFMQVMPLFGESDEYWKMVECDMSGCTHPLELYTVDLNWFIQYRLMVADADVNILQAITRIEERIRG